MDISRDYHFAVAKIYLVAGLSLALMTGSFYLLGHRPLSERLRLEHATEIEHFQESQRWLLEGVISRHLGLARQTASRTAIRKKQIAYLQGRATLEELISFSQSKLADAMRANTELVGIARFGPDANLLFTVGQQPPADAASRCGLGTTDSIRMLTPQKVGDRQRLVYCSPINDRDVGRVGWDLLVIEEDAINDVVDIAEGYEAKAMNSGVVEHGRVIYWPRNSADPNARGALESFVKGNDVSEDYIVRSTDMKGSNWQLFTIVNHKLFFAEIQRQTYTLMVAIGAIALLLFALTVAALRPIIHTLVREKQLLELSRRDGLTGLYNHAYVEEKLEYELTRAGRFQHPLSLLMFDIDYFKRVNDDHGHQTGDDVLKTLAQVIKSSTRKFDVAARYGGEEFIVILPETDAEDTALVAERLRKQVEETVFTSGAVELRITISVGAASYLPSAEHIDKRSLVEAADKALYASKDGGRNRITAVVLPQPNVRATLSAAASRGPL